MNITKELERQQAFIDKLLRMPYPNNPSALRVHSIARHLIIKDAFRTMELLKKCKGRR